MAPKANEPATPVDVDLSLLSRGVKAELRSLTVEHAEVVAAHLAAAAELIDTDPELAYAHAEAARRRAARLPVVREAAGTTAYAAGEFAAALNEFRALRRMTGTDDFLAVMADCERALGRPAAALKLVKEGLAAQPPIASRVELKLVEAGARDALGQRDEAVRLLRHEIELLGARGPKNARARLRYFFAQLLAEAGSVDEAEKWFASAVRLDPDDETGAAEALAELQGMSIEFDDTADDLYDEPAQAAPVSTAPGSSDEQLDRGDYSSAHAAPATAADQSPADSNGADEDSSEASVDTPAEQPSNPTSGESEEGSESPVDSSDEQPSNPTQGEPEERSEAPIDPAPEQSPTPASGDPGGPSEARGEQPSNPTQGEPEERSEAPIDASPERPSPPTSTDPEGRSEAQGEQSSNPNQGESEAPVDPSLEQPSNPTSGEAEEDER